ncbi:DUF2474 domain-containing protein [Agrobacterium sp. T29]|uniref:DUF2474 domain-containing protein n=1 Tax=Agrobacterium sp. T29 TaxID=2580515 RepID=UPI00352C1473
MVLLCLSRQGEVWRGVSLMPKTPTKRGIWLRRFGWLALIWIASVGALAIMAMLFRGLMRLAGMTA